MNLMDLVLRETPPTPWRDGEKIPWHEPAFSQRMLAEHLSQAHDLASRRQEEIERHVTWIHDTLLKGRPTRILDLGCGPGLYTERLARLGHTCLGVDHAPASIAHAEAQAKAEGLACRYTLADVRTADLGTQHGLAMMIFGELNVFRPEHARSILTSVASALEPGGTLLLEVHTEQAIERMGCSGSRFSTHERGLFGDAPYAEFEECFWDPATRTATTRWWIIDAETAKVRLHTQTVQAYNQDAYLQLLESAGFEAVHIGPSLSGEPRDAASDLFVVTAHKPVRP